MQKNQWGKLKAFIPYENIEQQKLTKKILKKWKTYSYIKNIS